MLFSKQKVMTTQLKIMKITNRIQKHNKMKLQKKWRQPTFKRVMKDIAKIILKQMDKLIMINQLNQVMILIHIKLNFKGFFQLKFNNKI